MSESLLQRVVDGVFGYDFFLSYAHADGVDYPRALQQGLRAMGFKVCIDSEAYVAGEDLTKATRRPRRQPALRRRARPC